MGAVLALETKVCTACGEEKPLAAFATFPLNSGNVGWRRSCRLCRAPSAAASAKRWAKAHPDRIKEANRRRWRTAPEASLKAGAVRRGILWNLTRQQYRELVSDGVCYYCAGPLPMTGGLDRLDNNAGYFANNCVPCCRVCNIVKNKFFTAAEMKRIGAVIEDIRRVRRG